MAVGRAIDFAVAAPVSIAVLVYAVSDVHLLDQAVYIGVFVLAGVAAWVGAARAPVGQRLVGRLIAAGITLTALGDTLWEVLDAKGISTDVSIADPPWFASYVMLCLALSVVLRRSGAGRHDLDFTLDAVTIVVVSVLVLWGTSIDTIVADAALPLHVRLVWAAYPVADAVLLALVVRVLTSRAARRCLDPSFAVGDRAVAGGRRRATSTRPERCRAADGRALDGRAGADGAQRVASARDRRRRPTSPLPGPPGVPARDRDRPAAGAPGAGAGRRTCAARRTAWSR